MKYKKIALIGMMGSGKTSISKELEKIFNIKAIDLDFLFEKEENISISNFFKKFSENEFRKKESILLRKIANENEFILSTGGGIILKKENRDILFNTEIFTIYLSASPLTIYKRIKNDSTRPLLMVDNPKAEIEKIIKTRQKYYSQADITIQTDNKTIKEIAEEIKWIL